MKQQHKSEGLRVEKIHKSERATHDRVELKENHDMVSSQWGQ